jgi:hypothetical protein
MILKQGTKEGKRLIFKLKICRITKNSGEISALRHLGYLRKVLLILIL